MARPVPSTTVALAILAGAVEPAESPLTARTRRTITAAITAARADIAAAVERDGVVATAERLGVARSTLALWRARGWLASAQEPDEDA